MPDSESEAGPITKWPKPSLVGLRRLSFCCSAPLFHPNPGMVRSVDASLELECARCGRKVTKFKVLNAFGVRIWPLPLGFSAKKGWKPRVLVADTQVVHTTHLPKLASKRIFR